MNEYYAVVRTTDHLAHYGVKGMKWGVRRAIKKNNMNLLSSHYARSVKKLETLKERTSRKGEKQAAKEKAVGGALGIGLGALGGLASYGIVKGQLAAQNALLPHDRYRTILHPVGLYGMSALSAGAGVGALGSSVASAYRSTKRGNKKAVEKYKKFKTEMDTAFKGQNRKKLEKHYNKMVGLPQEYVPSSNVTVHPMPQTVSNSGTKKKRR